MSNITLRLSEVVDRSEESTTAAENMESQIIQDLKLTQDSSIQGIGKAIEDLDDSAIVCYGNLAQKRLQDLTDDTLKIVITRDIGEVGNLLQKIIVSIDEFADTVASQQRLPKLLRRMTSLESLRSQYETTSRTLESIEKELDGWRMTLSVDLKKLTRAYTAALECYKELDMYVLEGKRKLVLERKSDLDTLGQGDEVDQDATHELVNFGCKCRFEAFEERLCDLELSKTICMQTAMQILLAEKTNRQLILSIQRGIINAISLWRQGIATALTVNDSKKLIVENTQLQQMVRNVIAMEEGEHQRRLLIDNPFANDKNQRTS